VHRGVAVDRSVVTVAIVSVLGGILTLFAALSAPAAAPAPAAHLGVASCAGSTCHGRSQPDGKIVRQDEIMRWQDPASPGGAHSRAYAVLRGARAEHIAHRLGIGDATIAPECVGCHADNAPLRGSRFQMSDGVGCEACHGGAASWIEAHKSVGASHARNVAHGMINVADPAARAAVCLDCHYGSAKAGQFVTHRIMAAGHPRLSFELDLFSALQTHYDFDADYIARKGKPNSVRIWAVGQAMAIERALSLYTNLERNHDGGFPEFYFFDCHSCHRRIQDSLTFSPTAIDNPARPVPPGTPPFNDENMIMLSAIAKTVAPAAGRHFDADARAFHSAIAHDRAAGLLAAARLRASTNALTDELARAPLTSADAMAILSTITTQATSARFTDYTGSAQSVMAVDTLLNALVQDGAVSRAAAIAARPDIDRAYAAVKDPNEYRPAAFRTALAGAVAAIQGLK